MDAITLTNWSDLENFVDDIDKRYAAERITPLLFRGQQDATWKAETSLEREVGSGLQVLDYYGIIARIQPEIQSFTGNVWEPILSTVPSRLFSHYDQLSGMWRSGAFPALEYMAFLRHHGFPSPLLDWSRSLYVAAFFATRRPSESGFSIYVLDERPHNIKSGSSDKPGIHRAGNTRTAPKRHFLQKSTYTACTSFSDGVWRFSDHESVFQDGTLSADFPQDRLWKLVLPATERPNVVRQLEAHNLNSFTLFGTDDSLMEALGTREFLRSGITR